MPGFLLHAGAVVMCAHAGQAQPIVTNPRVLVGGLPTVAQSSPYAVSACSFVNSPCVTAQWIVAAARVRSNGQPLLLRDSQALCTPNGTPLTVVFTQSRVRGT